MTGENHSLSRLWLRQRQSGGTAHISLGCTHTWGDSLCGTPTWALRSDEGVSSLCRKCRDAWQADAAFPGMSQMLPRGDVFMLSGPSGSLHRGPLFGGTERRAKAITRGLSPLSSQAFGPLGVMDASRGLDGLLHGDQWCADYDEGTVGRVPVAMGDDSVAPHHEGAPLHCHRRLSQDVEDGFFAALSVSRARNGLLSAMEHSGWGLYEAVRHEQGMHGTSDEEVCESGVYEVRSSLASSADALSRPSEMRKSLEREHGRTSEVWEAVKRVMDGWDASEEARAELGRVTLILALASGDPAPRAGGAVFPSLVHYGIPSGSRLMILNVCQARVTLGPGGWLSPLAANKSLVLDEVLPLLEEVPDEAREETAEDLADFMVSQDHAFCFVAERHMRDSQVGVLLEANPALIPEHWSQWPQGVDDRGRTLNWVPSPVAKVTPMDAMEASPAPFLPMTLKEAQAVLSETGWTR